MSDLGISPKDNLEELQSILGYRFEDLDLLQLALTHSSLADTSDQSNERQEFLGDAVLGLLICEALFLQFPSCREGQMTVMKARIVSRNTCGRVAGAMRLSDFLRTGPGLQTLPNSVLAGAVESVIAAVYLDGGMEAARALIRKFFGPELDDAESAAGRNFKSRLQEFCQQEFGVNPHYDLVEERGPDHSREFCCAAVVSERTFPAAWGSSKKQAEQKAARQALDLLEEAS